jgi:FlaG/FlaF family flagellin (archaellin)
MRYVAVALLLTAAAAVATKPSGTTSSEPPPLAHYEVIIVDATHGLSSVPVRSPADLLGVSVSPIDGWTEVAVRDLAGQEKTLRLPTSPDRVYVGTEADEAAEIAAHG